VAHAGGAQGECSLKGLGRRGVGFCRDNSEGKGREREVPMRDEFQGAGRFWWDSLLERDGEVADLISAERERERRTIDLIASENRISRAALEATASLLTDKYAEGYPDRRLYAGCRFADQIESLAIERAEKLFGAEHANVQPHSGSQANLAVFMALLEPGSRILAMDPAVGGHITHGDSRNLSGRLYESYFYRCDETSGRIDYERVAELAAKVKPQMIIAGGSFYPRFLDFSAFRQVADEAGARLMADMAHTAGLVAAGIHPSPVPFADVVTTTTHKTLRGPRGGAILCRREIAEAIDSAVFPGTQGGPLMHAIAGKAVCFREAGSAEFLAYQKAAVANARVLSEFLAEAGFGLVTGGTDTQMLVVDLQGSGLDGIEAEKTLERAGILVSKAPVPSGAGLRGIRLGTLAVTAAGMGSGEMEEIAGMIREVLSHPGEGAVLERIRERASGLRRGFPSYGDSFEGYCTV